MEFIIDDIKMEILSRELENNYRMSMVSKEWNVYCKARVATEYKAFKELCRRGDLLSIMRSYKNIHKNVVIYYTYAFSGDEVVEYFNRICDGYNKQYSLMGACRGGRETRADALLHLHNPYLLFYATKGRNMNIIRKLIDVPGIIKEQGFVAACYLGDSVLIDYFKQYYYADYFDVAAMYALRGHQMNLFEQMVNNMSEKASLLAIISYDDISIMKQLIEKFIDNVDMIRCIEIIQSGSNIELTEMNAAIAMYPLLLQFACTCNNHKWIDGFKRLNYRINSRYLDKNMIKHLMGLGMFYTYDSDMMRIYKLNDEDIITYCVKIGYPGALNPIYI